MRIRFPIDRDTLDYIEVNYLLTKEDLVKAGLLRRMGQRDYNFVVTAPEVKRKVARKPKPIHAGRWGSSP